MQDIGTAPTVGVYFADVVMPRGGAISYPAGAGAFFDLENIQVLNGPQGTLQGRNTTGGAKADAPAVVSHYDPERLDSYEAGFKWTVRAPVRGMFNASFFYNTFSNQQVMLSLSSLGNAAPASPP